MSFDTLLQTGVRILDEGVSVATPATSLDFVGAGVSATAIGSAATATIAGAASGSTVTTEKLAPTQSGANITLNLTGLSHTFVAIVEVKKNGQALDPADATFGWSRVGNTITVLNASDADIFLVQYTY